MGEQGSVRVLLVEDSSAQAKFILQALNKLAAEGRFDTGWVTSLGDALARLAEGDVDIVLLDLVLPDSHGLDTFRAVRAAHPEIPVVVLSGAGDDAIALEAVAGGAQDYLAKRSMSPEGLVRSLDYALERHRNLEGLRRVALLDELTGVYNRRGFLVLADQHLAVARRTGAPLTTLYVDVDGLKQVNDSHGHQAGDQALADVGALMRSTFRSSDVVGRVGGDEFCALLVTDAGQPAVAVARLQGAVEAHNATAGRPFVLSCSVGAVTHQPEEGTEVADLLVRADEAMYAQRAASRRPVVLVVEDDDATRRFYESVLRSDFEVRSTASGRAALEMARRQRPSLVLLDLGLPDMGGEEVMARLHEGDDRPPVPVVVATVVDDPGVELASFRAGADAFMTKPVKADELRRVVDRALARPAPR